MSMKVIVNESTAYANATRVHFIHKQKLSWNRGFEKARAQTFYFKNIRYTDCVGL